MRIVKCTTTLRYPDGDYICARPAEHLGAHGRTPGNPGTTYREGYFKTQPVKEFGAVPRLMMALARKRPDNGWAWAALAFGRFVWFEAYLPAHFVNKNNDNDRHDHEHCK